MITNCLSDHVIWSDMWSDMWLALHYNFVSRVKLSEHDFGRKVTTRVLNKLDRRCHPRKTIKARFEGIKRTYTTMFNVNTYDLPKPGFSIIIYTTWVMQQEGRLLERQGREKVRETLMINRKQFEMRIDIPNAIRLNRKRFEANICARYLIWNKEVIDKHFCPKPKFGYQTPPQGSRDAFRSRSSSVEANRLEENPLSAIIRPESSVSPMFEKLVRIFLAKEVLLQNEIFDWPISINGNMLERSIHLVNPRLFANYFR